MSHKFKKGDIVTLIGLNRDGTVLDALADGSYKVTLGNLQVTVSADQIKSSSRSNNSARHRPGKEVSVKTASVQPESDTIDLHGYIVSDAVAAVETKLSRAILANVRTIKIIHGVGSGKLKDAIHRYLGASSVVSAYKLDEFNPGVTWIYL